jgi:hypothetical protein
VAAERRYRYLPAAKAELITAATRYEQEREGLGERFLEAIDRALAIVVVGPERWPVAPRVSPRRGVHRYLLKRFPFVPSRKSVALIATQSDEGVDAQGLPGGDVGGEH